MSPVENANKERRQRESRISALEDAIKGYELSRSVGLQRVAKGDVTLETAREFARQYYPICLEFPIFLALCISRVYDQSARALLVENLYEEHGELDLTKAHPELFREFVEAVGLDPLLVSRARKGSVSEMLIRRYTENCSSVREHIALAYMYSFEKNFSGANACLAKGLRGVALVPEPKLIFFDVHAVHDIKHAAQLQEALLRITCTAQHWREVCDAAEESAATLYEFFDTVFR
jgi:pyrroloquinoline quinone (PQQ) biosynthesis protein C